MAFLLKAEIFDRPGAWICLEVHEQESFCNLDRLLRRIWFPTTKLQGDFFPKGKLLKKLNGCTIIERNRRLDSILQVEDCFKWTLPESMLSDEVCLEVVGHSQTAIMHCTADVVAFPLGMEGDSLTKS
jgi:hypothetical protein